MKKFAVILSIILCAFSLNAWAEDEEISILEQKFTECSDGLKAENDNCPETWSMKCYTKLMDTHKNTQNCYKEIAVSLFTKFYSQPEDKAEQRFNDFNKFIYDQYLFVFSETDYCKKNNCGIAPYLYSEYATTKQLHFYVNKIIRSVASRY